MLYSATIQTKQVTAIVVVLYESNSFSFTSDRAANEVKVIVNSSRMK